MSNSAVSLNFLALAVSHHAERHGEHLFRGDRASRSAAQQAVTRSTGDCRLSGQVELWFRPRGEKMSNANSHVVWTPQECS